MSGYKAVPVGCRGMMTRNHTGHRIGQYHHRAKLSSAQAQAMRKDHEGGLGYVLLSRKYGCGISTARDICTYRTRWNG